MPSYLRTILLVDDDPAWLRTVRILLLSQGIHRVLTCEDSRQLLDLLQQQPVNLILLDHQMPHLNAEQLLPLLQKNHQDIPVIVFSGQTQPEIPGRCQELGALSFFPKTTLPENLLAKIHRTLVLQHLRRAHITKPYQPPAT
ncbi:MAG: response regulator [Desulfuromonadales bacterium]|nr:response regulator [Desulfuromonadales bacterium]